jgi:hypothetical protein
MNRLRLLLFAAILFFLIPASRAQYSDYGFVRDYSVPVTDSGGKSLGRAWEGGLNACHYNTIDIDFDGKKDLVVFDKTGDKILCYRNLGISDSISYQYMPKWEFLFPPFMGWMQLKDYNKDGKEDIFAYAPAGIQVWKNISDTVLKFQLVTPLLNSYQGSGWVNIGLTYVDYPGIADIDGDGDLDILVFFGLGAYVEMHRNYAMEDYGNPDTLVFKRVFNCWGDFGESSGTNTVYLDITCPWKMISDAYDKAMQKGSGAKHTGSTMLLYDSNNDSLMDLVLGDVDYMNLVLLTNAGTRDTAHMGAKDTLFPSNSKPVNLVSFPLATMVDVNNDGLDDVIVSPFDPNPEVPEPYKSNWLYKNTGTAALPVFTFSKSNFLQGEMIEVGAGAYPVLVDIDGDGLQDLIVSNYGYLDSTYYEFGYLKSVFRSALAWYKNTGTLTNPEFTLMTRDFGNLHHYGYISLFPAFADLDHDGDPDLLCGQKNGTFSYFENTAGPGAIPVYAAPVDNYQGIDVGDASTPALVDLDNDGLIDLVSGRKTGKLSWYRNTGTVNNPVFTFTKDTLGGVSVTDLNVSYFGFSTPCFYMDTTGLLKLFVGSETGFIRYYKDIESNLYGQFPYSDSLAIYQDQDSVVRTIDEGFRTSVAVADLNGDHYPDLISGNFRGGLSWFKGSKPLWFSGIEENKPEVSTPSVRIYPNPAADYLMIDASAIRDASLNMMIFDLSGRCVKNAQVAGNTLGRIAVNDLAPGVYVYRMTAASLMQSGKLIIMQKP